MSKIVDYLLSTDKDLRRKFEEQRLAIEISEMLIEARYVKGITQEQLADMIGTKQSSIARFESGKSLPSLRFLEKIAKALDTNLISPKFAFLAERDFQINSERIPTVKEESGWEVWKMGATECIPSFTFKSIATGLTKISLTPASLSVSV